MRKRHLLAGSILAAACLPVVASAQTIVFQQDFDQPGAGALFNVQNAGSGDFQIDYHWDYGAFEYLRFPDGPAGAPVFEFIPPAPGGTTTRGLRISVNDTAGATVNVQLMPNGVNVSGNWNMTFDMWMNYNGGALGGTGSTETFVAGLNIDGGAGVIGPIGTANGFAFTATGEGGALHDYRAFDRGDPIDDGPNYPKVNATWNANTERRWNRDTNFLVGSGLTNDMPSNQWNSYWDEVFPGDVIGGGTFETRGAPGKNWVPVRIEQSDNEVLYYLNDKIGMTLFREVPASGVPSLGYADEFPSLAVPAQDNFIVFDNLVIREFSATPRFTATSGNYSAAGNWSAAVPNAAGLKAEFGGASGPATVTVDVPVTLRAIAFNSPNSYTVNGPQAISLTGEANSLINNGGDHAINANVNVEGHVSIYSAPGTTLSVPNLTTNENKAFGKTGTGTFETTRVRAKSLTVTGGVLKLAPGEISRVGSVATLNSTSRIDMTTHGMIVDYIYREVDGNPDVNTNPLADIYARIIQAWNGGTWDGNQGIFSSVAAANPNVYAVGYADAGAAGITTFGGEMIDESTILIRGTRRGDANLDGIVNLADFNRLAANFGSTDAEWWHGDFNYDGIVNLSDFNALAANFGLAAGPDGPTPDDWAALGAAVPEPGSLSLLGLAALAATRRRRR